jgi:hypothetical protein
MYNEVKFIKGMQQPSTYFYQVQQSETLRGFKRKISLLVVLSILIFAISAFFGVGTFPISKELTTLNPTEFELNKLFFLLGRMVQGLLYATVILFLPSLLFWTLSEADYPKLVLLQGVTLIILLAEKLLFTIFATKYSLDWYSSPLSLGVITQFLTTKKWIIYFFGCISLFKIWVIVVQFKGLKRLTEISTRNLLIIVLSVNIVFWCIYALLLYIDFSKLL